MKVVFASVLAIAMLAAGAASAHPHHRHQVCSWDHHHHHRMCRWL